MSGIRNRIGIALAVLVLVVGTSAEAHPHVWINTHAVFEFDQGKLAAVDLDWQFDDMFSAPMIEEFDKGKKGHFDAADSARLEKEVLPGFADFAWYLHLRVDGKEVKIVKLTNFHATLEEGDVRFRFTAVLPELVDPIQHKVEAGFYDETFYVDLELAADNPILFKGTTKCTDTITHDNEHKIYFGQIAPQLVKIACQPE